MGPRRLHLAALRLARSARGAMGAGGEQRRCLQTGLMFARPGRFNEIIFI